MTAGQGELLFPALLRHPVALPERLILRGVVATPELGRLVRRGQCRLEITVPIWATVST